jgi:hypothetical protein
LVEGTPTPALRAFTVGTTLGKHATAAEGQFSNAARGSLSSAVDSAVGFTAADIERYTGRARDAYDTYA